MVRYDPRWGAATRSKGRGHGWEVRPKWRRTQTAWEDVSEAATATAADDAAPDVTAWSEIKVSRAEDARRKYLQRATNLWGSPQEYLEYLRLESLETPELWESVALMFAGQCSSYRQRLHDERRIAKYDAKADKQVRDTVSVLRRRRSQLDIPFSTYARSVSYFNQRVPHRVWIEQRRGLRIGEHLHAHRWHTS